MLPTMIALALLAGQATPAPEAPTPASDRAATAATPVDAATARSMVRALADTLDAKFVDPAAAHAYAAMLRAKLAAGAYDAAGTRGALARQVTADLQATHRDGHLRVLPFAAPDRVADPAGKAPASAPVAAAPAPMRARPPAIEQADWIAPGIAYIRFNVFPGDPAVIAEVKRFLDTHGDAKTLIIDARTHHGGGLDEMDALFGRIYARRTPLMVLDTRAAAASNAGTEFGALKTLTPQPAPAAIKRTLHSALPDGVATGLRQARVFLLTSKVTGSAGEHLASALKATHRATLIGATTGGAGNYGHPVDLPGGFAAFVPVGTSYPPGGMGWEGTGVDPDIAVPAQDALVEALVRAGIPRERAVALDATHHPKLSMERI